MAFPDDTELLRNFRESGRQEYYFGIILEKYQQKLYWYIRRMVTTHEDADDVLQNTFLKIWRGLPAFRESSGLYTWMYRIATNESITFLKNRQKRRKREVDDPDGLVRERLRSDPEFSGEELYKKLLAAIDRLPAKQQLVFRMRYFEEVPYEDMSKIVGTSVGALKASYHHAVKKIQQAVLDGD
ncbi:MAG: sigma-70 family RNA polymerase sigma factor [Bacteroidales bacterium]